MPSTRPRRIHADELDERLRAAGASCSRLARSLSRATVLDGPLPDTTELPDVAEEQRLARRLEFERERLAIALRAERVPRSEHERILDRGPREADRRGRPRVRAAGDAYIAARGRFVARFLPLVSDVAASYHRYGLPVPDLTQEGSAALLRAVEKFDWRKGVRFKTYANYWIRQAIERYITANRGIVRIPNYLAQRIRGMRREGVLPKERSGMHVRDVAEKLDTTLLCAARLMATDRPWFSIHAGRERGSASDELPAPDEPGDGLRPAERRVLARRLHALLDAVLSEDERDVLRRRFGLAGGRRETLQQLGERMNLSRERVRQVQLRALGKLRGPSSRLALAEFA